MKASEARALKPGTVLATRGHGDIFRVTVKAVTVHGSREVLVLCADGTVPTPGAYEYRPRELAVPTPKDEARWEQQKAERSLSAAWRAALDKIKPVFAAEMTRVQEALGVKPSPHPGDRVLPPQPTYTVTLTREQALALTARIEALEAAAK